MFKSEQHRLIYLDKVGDKEAPYVIPCILNNNEVYDAKFDDFYLTPSEKYAKMASGFKSKARIVSVSKLDTLYVDNDFVSYELPKSEKPEVSEIVEAEEPKEEGQMNFEQISLFDEGDEQ